MKKTTVGMVNLGCAKNQVDGEAILTALRKDGFIIKEDAALAQVAIVNTCGFIDAAKKEAVDEILELARLKEEGKIHKIVVTGCLAERYQKEIHEEIPEVDAVVGIGANARIGGVIREMLSDGYAEAFPEKTELPICGERDFSLMSTPSYFAYIKISEGCNNQCAFCAIPAIRGPFRSRTMEDIEQEAKELAANGAKEIILIGQDTTRYGQDLYGEYSLAKLLKKLCKVDGIRWIRTLYCYPEAITDELLDVMASEEKIVKYIDIPLQHASGAVLKSMRRVGDRAYLTALVGKIRERVPGIVLRTTFLVGFPGETEGDFAELSEFVKEMRFERMGCFPYSQEEGTPAAEMDNQIDAEIKERRAEILMEKQMNILQEDGEKLIGTELDVLVEGFDRYAECWFGRSFRDAPEIDGKIFFTVENKKPVLGSIAKVQINECIDADLFGELIQ
ncbi:30S ribosomal protein S12 methylthiotransferase RimO [Scatolibacter rhodanostii]|uniref:30S ribosomal protein S12 methylthiotransferase RimO n=1 Tax=Scatolibacter rhodanostii TaxID=2014781 RepID=UPI000C08134D|nr:30S ribosomal protein S12 methylthiotransferase RimO [Scatolibacter rhodanostii]